MKTIVLFLGSNCNANCSYCHAAKRTEGSIDPSISLYYYLHEQMQNNDELTIWFLGGEPTLYMDSIHKIVTYCKGKNVSYRITTNGLRLCEDEIVDYLNVHNFYVTISFDGIRGIRGYEDVFYKDEYYQNLCRLKNIGCSITLSRNNLDIAKVAASFGQIENRLGRYLPFRPHYVHATTPQVAQLAFDMRQARQYADDTIRLLEKFIRDYEHGVFNLKLYPLFKTVYEGAHKNYQFPETRCFNQNYAQLDLQGNLYSCAYEPTKANTLGTVANERRALNGLADFIIKKRPKCLTCEFYPYCGSHCLISIAPQIECYIHKRLITWLFETLDKTKIDYAKIEEQEFARSTGGIYGLYR